MIWSGPKPVEKLMMNAISAVSGSQLRSSAVAKEGVSFFT
jgi:hypothetical protein